MRVDKFFKIQGENLQKNSECAERNIEETLTLIKFSDGHIHRVVPKTKEVMSELINNVICEEDINPTFYSSMVENNSKSLEQKPIVFRNRQAIGDILMMTCAIRDFKATFPNWPINVATTAMHIWDNNPNLDRSVTQDRAELVDIGPSKLTNASNRDDRHFANAFRLSIEEKLGVSIVQGPAKADIWMTKKEVDSAPLVKPPYWVITAGEKGDWTTKTYPFSRWQEFVNRYPQHKFVQIGVSGGRHKHPVLQGDNIVNFIGQTQGRHDGIRRLMKLFYHAQGTIGMISLQMHLASAFNMPCIVVAGAREPARFTQYPGHQYLVTDGCLPCAATNACWSCDIDKSCKQVSVNDLGEKFPLCVDIITVDDICRAFDQYYEGKRLTDKVRPPTISNSPVEKAFEAHKDINLDTVTNLPEKFGFDKWGGSSITDRDWLFIKNVIEDNKIKSILEFGAGLSTCLMNTLVKDMVTYESVPGWLNKFRQKYANLNLNIRQWDGKTSTNVDLKRTYDLGFVDGPAGGKNRNISTKIASELCKIVIVHDAGREWETKWQEKYLVPTFTHVKNGGHRCKLWVKKEVHRKVEREKKRVQSGKPLLKMVFNGRGEGGAESSTTWIMNRFIDMGWDVQYISPVGPSATFNKIGNLKVRITKDLTKISDECDILCVYCNDYVWEFPKLVMHFVDVKASRKVMCVNFRLGQIGKVDWTTKFDDYIFLNSSLETLFKTRVPNSSTHVLAPPIDLSPFYKAEVPEPKKYLELIRHNSQGDTKYPKDFKEKLELIISRFPDILIRLMPAPSFLKPMRNVIQYRKNQPPIPDYLKIGNTFFYHLPEGYQDQGPKVIMEAMATGLPVIADNHSGPKDRVVPGTGFLCDSFNQHLDAIEKLQDPELRFEMGSNAREHAKKEFNPENWITKIIG